MPRRLALLAVLLVTLAAALPVAAQSPEDQLDEIERRIHELNESIEQAEGRKSEVAEQLAATEARMADLRAQLAAAQAAVDQVQAEIAGVEEALAEVRLELAALKEQLAATREEIRHTRDLVRRRAVEMYMEGSDAFSGVLLAMEEVSQVAVGLEYAAHVVASSEQLVNQLEILKRQEERQQELMEAQESELEAVVATLEQRKAELERRQAELEAARAAVEAERNHQRALIAEVEHQISHIEGEVAALEREQARIEAEIRARQSQGTERSAGVLLWPLNGQVTSGFGYRIHPITGARKLHTGIDIDGSYGEPIVAAASGTVILASWYGGYGNAIVIDHGGGLATLYAHMSSMAAGVGSSVQAGQVIGYVGSTGFSTGPHLHFEVRENGTPVDPMGYLQ